VEMVTRSGGIIRVFVSHKAQASVDQDPAISLRQVEPFVGQLKQVGGVVVPPRLQEPDIRTITCMPCGKL
jgi:hypothetical protein